MAVVTNTQTINADNNVGLGAIGAGLGAGLCCIGSGMSAQAGAITGAASQMAAAQTTAATTLATAHTAANTNSWINQLLIPGLIAAAQLLLLEKQKSDYNEIAQKQRDLMDEAVDNYSNCLDGALANMESAYPGVPSAAHYVTVDQCDEQLQQILCNIAHAGKAEEYADRLRLGHQTIERARMTFFYGTFTDDSSLIQSQTRELLDGKLPFDDVMEILSDTAESACMTGRLGNVCHVTARNLGISRLRAQAAGRATFSEHVALLNTQVSPVARLVDMQTMMRDPVQRIAIALQQAILVQNSLQNAYNLAAQVPLWKTAKAQAKLQGCITKMSGWMSKANLVNTFVPNYAAILSPTINTVANGLGGMIGGSGGSGSGGNSFGSVSFGSGFTTGLSGPLPGILG